MEKQINTRDDNYYVAVAFREAIVWGRRSREQPCCVGRYGVERLSAKRYAAELNVWLRGDCIGPFSTDPWCRPGVRIPFLCLD